VGAGVASVTLVLKLLNFLLTIFVSVSDSLVAHLKEKFKYLNV
jgi:hypothetical protein